MSTTSRPSPGSPAALEADIEAARLRLADTVDELAARATPKAILRRQVEAAKARLVAAATTPEGDLRVDRIVAVGVAAAALIGLVAMRRRRRG
jgi:MYXO-CTERM domain-containing protein